MNFKKVILFSGSIFMALVWVQGQSGLNKKIVEEKPLQPIVQVFSAAGYTLSKGAENKFGFGIGRAHLGLKYCFSDRWNAKIIIDRGRPTMPGPLFVTDSSGNSLNIENNIKTGSYYTMTLKFASLQWNATDKLTIEAGSILQNHYITQERFWGYRYVSQTFQDLYYHIPSGDLGIIAYYRFSPALRVDLAITNGEGFRVNQDPFGNVKTSFGLDLDPTGNIQTRVFMHIKPSDNPLLPETEYLFSVFAGYKSETGARIGAEYNRMQNYQNSNHLSSGGFSVYGSYPFSKKMAFFARYDRLLFHYTTEPLIPFQGNGTFLLAGIHFQPVMGVSLSANYRAFFADASAENPVHQLLINTEFKF